VGYYSKYVCLYCCIAVAASFPFSPIGRDPRLGDNTQYNNTAPRIQKVERLTPQQVATGRQAAEMGRLWPVVISTDKPGASLDPFFQSI
jgi:hypothetical protein